MITELMVNLTRRNRKYHEFCLSRVLYLHHECGLDHVGAPGVVKVMNPVRHHVCSCAPLVCEKVVRQKPDHLVRYALELGEHLGTILAKKADKINP